MTKSSSPNAANPAHAISAPVGIWIDGDAGGIGKSILGVLTYQAFYLADQPCQIFELDDQGKLARFLGSDNVTALHGASASRDGEGEQDTAILFAPFHEAITSMSSSATSVLLEVGGSLTGLANDFAREVDLEEDLEMLGLTLVIFLVIVATEESVRQALAQLAEVRRIIPSAQAILVLNERDGNPLSAAADLPGDLGQRLRKAAASAPTIRIPKLREKSRRLYEKLGRTPAEIVTWRADHYAEAVRQTGRPLLFAKRFVKDVAAWSAVVQDELTKVLPFLGGEIDE